MEIFGFAAVVFLLISMGFSIQLYGVGIGLTAATLVLFGIRRVNLPKAISYCCFFLVGTVVAKLHWRLSTDAPPVEVHELIYPTIIMVVIFSLIGFLSWLFLKKWTDDKLLIAIIVLTFFLPVIALSYPSQLLTWYVRFYVVICLVAPVVVLAQTWNTPREPHAPG